MGLQRRFGDLDSFWERHANPKSGWSRLLSVPLLLAAAYTRDRRVLAVALGWTVVNPVAFPRVDRSPEGDPAWMTRVVDAERAWLRGDVSPGGWDRLNAFSAPVTAYALYAAYRRRPVRAVIAGAASMALKLAYVWGLERRWSGETAGRR
ncbi:DUF6653 family protein [Halobaculum halobium]|uniref:DUF6653 family protein n=1 Tax=Halobaculum halobium TaxID=3032281 RepID=A0ABD5TE74_9EURY|nr:DUF6653 family protein [Halobaculum sp. SYNS20]